ncbi:hypothetical protein LL06_21170 [Hoeflea sp. BAL378]|nr:hypothetical protein LL06_21170 [Hoeflea sp. BAL378]
MPCRSAAFADPLGECLNQPVKRSGQRIAACDNHIVVSGLEGNPCNVTHGFFETAAHSVALDRIALFFRHCVADAGRVVRFAPVEGFQQEIGSAQAFALLHGEEIRAGFKPPGFLGDVVLRHAIFSLRGPSLMIRPKDDCARGRGEPG